MFVRANRKRLWAVGLFLVLGATVAVSVVEASCSESGCPSGHICCDECNCCIDEDALD